MKMTDLDFWGRIHSGYYEAKFVSFDYKEYRAELLDNLNHQRLTKAEYDEELKALEKDVKALKQKHLDDYRSENAKLMGQFYKDCEIEFDFSDLPTEVKDFIHGKAYEDGHAWGFESIAGHYEGLVNFVKICKEAFAK
jgi:hypothetical protein